MDASRFVDTTAKSMLTISAVGLADRGRLECEALSRIGGTRRASSWTLCLLAAMPRLPARKHGYRQAKGKAVPLE
ncbi:hypothetical protein NHX12_015239 [Muraenolepis orangiensis]|uniref:Uncharacterized protein n=1 Tax=Muraenolepis orangiensis TaxID=630683 RepID=A0A9Q0DA76_9TELE|nr:hypothetical protein NHX12_015239 [Muraenolepis orangiensis]